MAFLGLFTDSTSVTTNNVFIHASMMTMMFLGLDRPQKPRLGSIFIPPRTFSDDLVLLEPYDIQFSTGKLPFELSLLRSSVKVSFESDTIAIKVAALGIMKAIGFKVTSVQVAIGKLDFSGSPKLAKLKISDIDIAVSECSLSRSVHLTRTELSGVRRFLTKDNTIVMAMTTRIERREQREDK